MGLCLGPYDGPRGEAVSCERGTPIHIMGLPTRGWPWPFLNSLEPPKTPLPHTPKPSPLRPTAQIPTQTPHQSVTLPSGPGVGRDPEAKGDLIAASIFHKFSVGPSIRKCTRNCSTMTNRIQVYGNFHGARAFIINTRPDEISSPCARGRAGGAIRDDLQGNLAHEKTPTPQDPPVTLGIGLQ